MPVNFIDNYSKNNLSGIITKKDGTPLNGEIWVYEQFLHFNENNFLKNENWYLKHNYNLSLHPSSKGKVEGQIDFLLITKSGILIIEVKGGGIKITENDEFVSYNSEGEYKAQNPFFQAKEYVHSLRELLSSNVFIAKAVIFPHEAGFETIGPQLVGYKDFLFSKRDYASCQSSFAINELFFNFIKTAIHKNQVHNLKQLNPSWENQKINDKIHQTYSDLKRDEIERLKSELLPNQSSYGYNPKKINAELILNENYSILQGLKRNRKVIIQGEAGTGKTILAQKFIAENSLKQQRGIVFCANVLIKKKLEYILLEEYKLDSNNLEFRIFNNIEKNNINKEIDYFIFDESQEYFDKGLYDYIEHIEKVVSKPKILVLYDSEQTIVNDYKDLSWYPDFFIEDGFCHYYFDEVYRSIKNPDLLNISKLIRENNIIKLNKQFAKYINTSNDEITSLQIIKEFIDNSNFLNNEKIILVQSDIYNDIKKFLLDYFSKELEELSENNINILSYKIRFTTPIKYRGLENKSVLVITDNNNTKSFTQLYLGVTRAIENLKIIFWNRSK